MFAWLRNIFWFVLVFNFKTLLFAFSTQTNSKVIKKSTFFTIIMYYYVILNIACMNTVGMYLLCNTQPSLFLDTFLAFPTKPIAYLCQNYYYSFCLSVLQFDLIHNWFHAIACNIGKITVDLWSSSCSDIVLYKSNWIVIMVCKDNNFA